MRDLPHHFAVTSLLVSGSLMALFAMLPESGWPEALGATATAVWHRQFMMLVLGGALLLSVRVTSLRFAALGTATLSQAGLLAIVITSGEAAANASGLQAGLLLLLIVTTAILARDAWRQARWDGLLPSRPEV